jgi:hypothetical protein
VQVHGGRFLAGPDSCEHVGGVETEPHDLPREASLAAGGVRLDSPDNPPGILIGVQNLEGGTDDEDPSAPFESIGKVMMSFCRETMAVGSDASCGG